MSWRRDPNNPTGRYVLGGPDGKTPVPEPDLMIWGRWLDDHEHRRVAETVKGDVRVSTVFMALDHNFEDHGPPILFETMVFRHGAGEECERYSTWAEAEAGHRRMCAAAFGEEAA
jgi:hypothetical protein